MGKKIIIIPIVFLIAVLGIRTYNKIEDNYPKYVISMDKFDFSQNGIIHKNIIDWLLKNEK